ncbi:MAG: sialate O-acetylesterase [Ferruginibacter sp.]|uniref:sialate O-acetylesterase n=1 Tax=Ferruginibacter sp. TaxID=1940288 RepID=UPI0026583AD8|nr:sialate O-acetylesterase [Ferruginibacter sp.]MDB5279011.1 sialate O-acetylesterase [Ferruginibacter sp.]
MKKCFAIVTVLLFTLALKANIRLPNVINNNMVLQQQSAVKLWGWAGPAEKIFVTTSWDNKTDSVIATRDAVWSLSVKTPAAGGPYTITLKGQNTIVLNNVLIGEVWVCSGQSNMEMNDGWGGIPDIKAALPACANSNIRFFTIPKTTSQYPQDNCGGEWVACDSNTLKVFSAVAYFFGKKLNTDMNVPVGLISTNWGGTPAETWTEAGAINNDPELKNAAAKQQPYDWWPYLPGAAFNGMIAPVTNYNIAGAIWYQGEGNTIAPDTYGKLLTTMIGSWRKAWSKELPFYYVQIAPFTYENKFISSVIREQQTKAMIFPNVGMAVITDLVDNVKDIHPKGKRLVGERLANWALAQTYHKDGLLFRSPMYKSMEVQKNKVVITFDNAPNGLMTTGKNITEVYIAGADKIFVPATAKIDKDKLIVTSTKVPQPVAVRFSFSNAAMGNLFSKEGLPVNPFRTDDWELDRSKE